MSPVHAICEFRLEAGEVRLKPDTTTGSETVLSLNTLIIPGIGPRLPLT